MKTKAPVALLSAWLAVVLAPAQAAESTGSTTTPKPEAEAIVLSPFVVNSAKDIGYAATNTLAGTRLNTSLKDIGTSISIYTKDFLTDLGTTNANELLIYATGMEAAGAQGNYSGSVSSINATQVFGDSIRTAPQSGTRTRGLASPSYSRGLFNTSIPIDSFNTETVTVNRGPNAILFGVSSPAGVVDTTLLQANLRRNLNKVELRYGNNDSFRSSLDLNRVLVPNKLAMRFAAVSDNEKFNQRPAFENKRRIFGTATAKPFRSTTLRGSFETGHTDANRPFSVLPLDSISRFWYAAGRPVYDWSFYDDPARNPNAAAQRADGSDTVTNGIIGSHEFFDQVGIVYNRSNGTTPDLSYKNQLQETLARVPNAVRANLFHPLVNRDSSPEGQRFGPATLNIGAVSNFIFPGGIVPAGIKNQGFTNFDAFDFKNRMLDETASQSDSFRTFHVAIEQTAWKDRLGVEVAYNTERYDRRSSNFFLAGNGSGHIRIDAAVTLPTGQPNPNVGRPFMMMSQVGLGHNYTERESARATAFARYDFKDASPRLGRWLGRHTLTGLYQNDAADTVNHGSRLSAFGPAADTINANPFAFGRQGIVLVYIGDSIIDGRPLKLEPVQIPRPKSGLTAQTPYFSAPAGSAAQGDFTVGTTTFREINTGGRASRDVIKSHAAVLQSHWLDGHLVTILGWRRDENYFASQVITFLPANPDKVEYGFSDFDFPSTPPLNVSKEVKTYSAVLRWPQKLVRLPFGADLGVFINASDNFTPSGGRVNPYNEPLSSPAGETREYGLNLSFLNDRFALRVNRFETSVKGQSFSSYGNSFNNAVLQHTGFWAMEQNINPHIDRSADIELMYSVLPPNFRQIHSWRVFGTAAEQTLGNSYSVVSGVSDTTDYTAKGTEAEFTFTPNRQWRILVNVANQETVQTNIAPGLKEFVARMRPVWNQLAGVPVNNYPSNHVLGAPLPANVGTHGDYINRNINAPLAALIATEGVASAEQRKWRANLVANYTFGREGPLKGWSVGTGVRWQDKLGIGYPASYSAPGRIVYDIQHPYYVPAETNVDLFTAYTRKLRGNRIEWKAQLNVRNAIGQGDPIGVTVQPWGETAITRLPPERRWYLTNTFSF